MFRSGGVVFPKKGSLLEETLQDSAATASDASNNSKPICFRLLIRTLA
jgi:hypothetical protein